ncbi:non-hydrolyzing UDP-N-acetylglucosamine 2-epimerase [Kutzneria sp. CA-103260]|uniref:non-hydrolyzing UDP-N-acetylglucosamine 2-epimerase n=1 Tax=Kutzneria sp. CA-103260 TaxID=2802641 RepID=UPI001BA749DD|nr:UDP-N-acetylglucosamine 2-epimerase (non-hydrolyzing) [Kutzneria sp. CA-103260]QUQ64682.1 UDP-N-acetylglucosamine 2-epimerase [Kutzneria sp. CA-103260]
MPASVDRTKVDVALVVGTRPEAVKMAPVARALDDSGWAQPILIATGQHGDVVREVFDLFDLKISHELEIARDENSVAELSARLLVEIDAVLGRHPVGLVLVQGDTATTLAGGLAGFFRRVPVAHLEAGMRTHDLDAPFPEEGNRRLVGQVSSLHLAPTPRARDNLLHEGVPADRVVLTGNTVVDALLSARRDRLDEKVAALLDIEDRPVVVVTAHRRESWGEPLRRIGRAVARLARLHPDALFVVAAHMNPAVRSEIETAVAGCLNVHVAGPVAYGQFLGLLARAQLVLTDSGGIQEEAPTFGVPVLVTRESTERTESVDAGRARLVGTDEDTIVSTADELLTDPAARSAMNGGPNPYGDGLAGQRVVEACAWLLGRGRRPAEFVAGTGE